jgi:ubiquinone/menaquinone biosynthesis C-methylase UbiE
MKNNKNVVPSIQAEILEHYSESSEMYEQTRLSPYMQFIEATEKHIIAEYKNLQKNCVALEIGCGTGRFSEYLSEIGCDIYATDLTPAMLRQARSIRHSRKINWIGASAEHLPFTDGSFDLVIALKVLPHVPDLPLAIAEIKRVMKRGGIAILEFYNPLSLGSVTRRFRFFTQWHQPFQADRLLTDAGLNIADRRGIRTIIPFGAVMNLPIISTIFRWIETRLSNSRLCRFSSYYIVIAKSDDVSSG